MLEFPLECALDEAVVAYPGPVESYGIHALEMLQSMVERRQGGESGIKAVQCLEGEAVWLLVTMLRKHPALRAGQCHCIVRGRRTVCLNPWREVWVFGQKNNYLKKRPFKRNLSANLY